MSTLKVTNIQATGETASRAVSGVAAAVYGVNQNPTTYMGIATDTTSSQSTNISSYTDDGTGLLSLALTNAMSNTQYVFLSGVLATNNTACINGTSTTSTVAIRTNDADTSNSNDTLSYGALFGDLA